jgi:hypothetical protein
MSIQAESSAKSGKGSRAVSGPTTATSQAAYVLSTAVAVLAGSASLVGLVRGELYAQPAAVVQMLRGYDVVTLVLVVPLLVVSPRSARRGSDRAALVWLGMLAYLLYTYAYYVFGTSFNGLFLLHILIFGGSLFALVTAVIAFDVAGTAARFSQRTPRRLIGFILALLAAALGFLLVYFLLAYAVTGDVPAGSALVEPDLVVHLGIVLDLALLVPSYAVAAVLVWRAIPSGYVLAGVVLIAGSLHQISYMVALWFQARAGVPGAVPFDPVEPLIAAFLAATGLLLYGAEQRHPLPS